MSILEWGPIARTRRNHALEHATLQVLARSYPTTSLAGFSDTSGFWLLGRLSTEDVLAAAQEAALRLENGERALAIHPHCGTNLAVAGALAGTLAWLGSSGSEHGWRARLERWPLMVTLATLAVVLSQPLGPWLQERVTTLATLHGLHVVSVERSLRGELPVHHVWTAE